MNRHIWKGIPHFCLWGKCQLDCLEVPSRCVRQAVIKKTNDNGHCWETFIHCSWKCKMMQSLWKPIWRFLKYLKIEVSCDVAIPLLGIYLPNGLKSIRHRDTCISYSDLLPHCSQWLGNGTALTSINRWMAKKYGIYKHNRNLFSHRENEMEFAGKWMELEIVMFREISQTRKDKHSMFFLIWEF